MASCRCCYCFPHLLLSHKATNGADTAWVLSSVCYVGSTERSGQWGCADIWCNGLYQQIPSGYSFLIQFSTAKRRRNLVLTCSLVHWRRHNSKGTRTRGWAVSDKSTNGSLPRAEAELFAQHLVLCGWYQISTTSVEIQLHWQRRQWCVSSLC